MIKADFSLNYELYANKCKHTYHAPVEKCCLEGRKEEKKEDKKQAKRTWEFSRPLSFFAPIDFLIQSRRPCLWLDSKQLATPYIGALHIGGYKMLHMSNIKQCGIHVVSQVSCTACSWSEKCLHSCVYSKQSLGDPQSYKKAL